jgi:glucose-1-phosphate cytidylyltransferase
MLTAVRPPARFGVIQADWDGVIRFDEKAATSESWINGGFFVLNQCVLDYTPAVRHHSKSTA